MEELTRQYKLGRVFPVLLVVLTWASNTSIYFCLVGSVYCLEIVAYVLLTKLFTFVGISWFAVGWWGWRGWRRGELDPQPLMSAAGWGLWLWRVELCDPFARFFFCLFDLAGTHRRELFNALWSSTNLKGDRYIIIWGISMKAIWPADACGQCWCWCRSLYLGPLCDCVCSRALVCLQGACDGIGMSTVQPLLVCFWWPFAWICVLWVHCPLKS